jgi:chemotaxis protein methyltransferase CheR
MTNADFEFIAGLLKEKSGLIVTPDKLYLLEARLLPIARKRGIDSLAMLMDTLRRPDAAPVIAEVVDAMTTNETSFFRDRTPFEQLKKQVVPALVEKCLAARTIRIWSAACSTGQEPYSLAIMLKDDFPLLAGWKVEIVATDISPSVLERAREGVYSQFEVQRGLPVQTLVRHFDQNGENWQIKPELRRMIDFRSVNLLGDFSALGSFDLILCRNVLIYFDQPTKSRILGALSQRLAPHGALFLGGAESVFGLSDKLGSLNGLRGVYCRAPQTASVNAQSGTRDARPPATAVRAAS